MTGIEPNPIVVTNAFCVPCEIIVLENFLKTIADAQHIRLIVNPGIVTDAKPIPKKVRNLIRGYSFIISLKNDLMYELKALSLIVFRVLKKMT